ncbi:MAG: response regulator [Gemmatimonadota bacterium]|nr:response regulator [Gemmatimonadota bacterium]
MLIVDDDPGVCFALRRLLESVGEMRAVVAESADAGEAELARGAVDALVLDFHLRGMRGDAFFHRACEMQPSLAERTLFISGDMSADANDAMAATGCPMLMKPFLASALIARLRELTAHAQPRQARSA